MNRISTASESVRLRPQLMEVLVYLAGLEGQVATLESIHDDLWSGRVVSSGTIYNCIAELRRLLSRGAENIEYIETLPKKGYRLAPPIITRQRTASKHQSTCSIAILPLLNRSDDADIEYLCDGISDEILFGLSKVEGLTVFSTNSLKQENLDARVVGLRFGAQMVLGGSLQVSGQKLRVMFKLQKVSDGKIIWSGRFDQPMDDIFKIQDDVARQVIGALSPSLPVQPPGNLLLEGSGTKSLEALNAFLLGKHAYSRSSLRSFDEAIEYFAHAVAIDPSFARAYYRLYLANYMKRRSFGIEQGTLEKARIAAQNAERLGFKPAVPWIHIHRRLYKEKRLSSRNLALEAINKLLIKDAEWGSFAYEQLTWVLADAGLFNATLAFAKRMLDSPDHNFEDSDADEEVPHYTAACGQLDEAIRLWSGLIQKEPLRQFFRRERSILYARTGQWDYAAKDIGLAGDPGHFNLSAAFLAYYRGNPEDTRRYHEHLLSVPNIHPSYRLWTCCMIGDFHAAMNEYEKSVSTESRSYIDFGNVRAMSRGKLPASVVCELEQHPRFIALMKKEGIDDAWQRELIQRLNAISDITGVVVQAD